MDWDTAQYVQIIGGVLGGITPWAWFNKKKNKIKIITNGIIDVKKFTHPLVLLTIFILG
jgi:uncharacterized membrane protein